MFSRRRAAGNDSFRHGQRDKAMIGVRLFGRKFLEGEGSADGTVEALSHEPDRPV